MTLPPPIASLTTWLRAQPGRLRARTRELTRADVARLLPAALLLLATWALFWILGRHLTYSWASLDEKHFIWEGWSLNRGLVPYRDFTDFKPPRSSSSTRLP